MNTLVFLVLAASVCIYATPIDNSDWRIVGGQAAENGSVPYQVSLRTSSDFHFCGGSIISSKTILTAAHCLVGSTAADVFVVVGTNQLNTGGTKYESQTLIVHPQYNSVDIYNDVGIIILENAIVNTPVVKSIPIDTLYTNGSVIVTLTGWGRTSTSGAAPDNLQTIDLKTITYEECKTAMIDINSVYDSEICTYTKSGEGACNGDSGGPLVANGKQVGIVSWGIACARGYPDVFTRVSSFASWIQNNTVV